MAAKVARHFSLRKASVLVFIAVALITALFMVRMTQGEALPGSPTDSTAVPHYFGPWTNWALSPLTLPDATVTITGDGTGAEAVATVGGNGVVTGIAVTNPGNGYSTATVEITGAGTGAAATATITNTGAIIAVNVTAPGGGYKAPTVTISGGGATEDATASAYGGVDTLTLQNAGTGYQFPTVDFDMPDDPNGVKATAEAVKDPDTGAITAINIVNPGSGYLTAPQVVIRDGTLLDPVANAGAGASAVATIDVQNVMLDTFGAGYTSAPTVTITDAVGSGSGATADATVDNGLVSEIALTAPGSGYVTPGGIKKFQDQLPVLCNPAVPGSCSTAADAKFLPIGVPVEKSYDDAQGDPIKADEYEIALIQWRTKFNADLPPTLVRAYVQIATPEWLADHPGLESQIFPLQNELLDGTKQDVMIDGVQAYGVTSPQWLGPVLVASKNKPVRVVFRNLLPTGADGDLFLPVDSTLMGSGMGPMGLPDPVDEGSVMDEVRNQPCSESPKQVDCFKDNRATLHLHGGISPWISDGTPHQWITPANEDTPWPEGVDVRYVPDMPVGNDPDDGIMTFYYTNQQSARLMFYHDHAWGTTRLNVYAGEAAGYIITDETEQKLVDTGTIPSEQIPLIVQDRTFVPDDHQMYDVDGAGNVFGSPEFDVEANGIGSYGLDPTWDKSRWGGYGSFWIHHVYMPAQNPGDPSGLSAYGRWMYGPWFWPPAAATKHGPIANPYYNPACKLEDPATWQYQTDPFCEPQQIPGTPNISAGMEQFNDTPTVNGIAYPEITLQPKSYRFRVLNAANDRFFNFQWYVADPTTGTDSEVALDPQLLAQAQTDPVVFPTPVHNAATNGPDWVQIGTEGGFLPAPVVVDGQQETTWITDPTRFDVGNVDKHSLLLAPAERADVIVDFSKFAGKTLIMYNDAPAAFPARVPSYDYYTGQPDLWPNGPAAVLPGYGPNTRTIMRVKIAAAAPAAAFNLTKLRNAFSHKTDGSGVFESGQHPIIVGQKAYNSAYGTSFSGASDCNALGSTLQICDGFLRVNDTATFGFNTLKKPTTKSVIEVQPKAIHDEMNASTFDEFGRMQANLGIEAQPPTPGLQNVTLYPFVNPVTEIIDATNLPKNLVIFDANGNAVDDVRVEPVSSTQVGADWKVTDGTQIWRVTHNGVDTHPIHFHLYDVQVLNRVTWDNTIVARRAVVPDLPWEVDNAIRNLNPMDPQGSTDLFNSVDVQGNPLPNLITNQLVNNGWGYVWHCHILSHEEMDMMRPQAVALPPVAPDNLVVSLVGGGTNQTAALAWDDNSITETAFAVQRSEDYGQTWTNVGTIQSPLDQDNIHQPRAFNDPIPFDPATTTRYYRVAAENTVGYGQGLPELTVQSYSNVDVTGPSFTITATAGANGSITPVGAVEVGQGANQAFTFAPNTNYRIDQVLIDGVPDLAAAAAGTYTFIDVQADHQIDVTFTQSLAVITSTAGAGGSIAPLGNQTVAIGGSQLYTITPNNGYHIADVKVDGVSNPDAVTNGTYTFLDVVANHTIDATFAANTLTITSTTGANGTITPLGAQTVPFGGSQSFTITPNAGYHILSVLIDGVPNEAAAAAGAYTFTNVTASHTISASFEINPTVTVTYPSGGETLAPGLSVNATWDVSPGTTTGYFRVWAQSPLFSWWPLSGQIGATGATSYSLPWTVALPPASDWKLRVYYYSTDGTLQSPAASAATFTVSPATPTVTSPAGGETFAQGENQNVTWTMPPGINFGYFRVWAQSPTLSWWPLSGQISANGATSYTLPWLVSEPAGTDWKVRVYFYADDGTLVGPAASASTFAITSATPTVTAPTGGESFLPGTNQSVLWTMPSGVDTGYFRVWAQSPTLGWWPLSGQIGATGATNYTLPWVVTQPAGTDWKVRVYYYTNTDALVGPAASAGSFTIL
jgi:FtsP/CotA-like multicopper oxidase with cupredoxin domain